MYIYIYVCTSLSLYVCIYIYIYIYIDVICLSADSAIATFGASLGLGCHASHALRLVSNST